MLCCYRKEVVGISPTLLFTIPSLVLLSLAHTERRDNDYQNSHAYYCDRQDTREAERCSAVGVQCGQCRVPGGRQRYAATSGGLGH